MQKDHHGQSFMIDVVPAEKMDGVFDVNIMHMEPKKVVDTITEKRQVMQEVETKKKDTKGKFIIERKPVIEDVTIETERIEMTNVKVGSFTIYAKVDKRTLRQMVENWFNHSSAIAKLIKAHGN